MRNSPGIMTVVTVGLIILAGCSSGPETVEVWLIATPTSLTSPASSTIKATVKSSGAEFSGIVTFKATACGTITPASATVAGGIATTTFTPDAAAVTENCPATITAEASNGRSWPLKTIYATGTTVVKVLPAPVTSAAAPASANPAGSPPTQVIVKPSVTPRSWNYQISLSPVEGRNDRIVMLNITLSAACPKPTSTGFAPTITPASGSSMTWSFQYPGSGVTNDDITFEKCNGKTGGMAQFDVRLNTIDNIVPAVSVAGPK